MTFEALFSPEFVVGYLSDNGNFQGIELLPCLPKQCLFCLVLGYKTKSTETLALVLQYPL